MPRRAPGFLAAALPGLDREQVRFVPHHVAHAASAALAAPVDGPGRPCSVLVLDGRGEQASHLAGHYEGGRLEVLAAQALPHSLGLLYESLTEHLGFLRSSDEYKVMALASYGRPAHLETLRETLRTTADGGFEAPVPDWTEFAPRRGRRRGRLAAALRRPRVLGAGAPRGAARRARDAGCTSAPATGR